MTNHPHRSKKAWSTVRVSARDARDLALMLKLHSTACEEQVSKCWNALPAAAKSGLTLNDEHPEYQRTRKAVQSWSRAARKARSFALQFEEMALAAENGMTVGQQQLR